jgi:hypothetical protein
MGEQMVKPNPKNNRDVGSLGSLKKEKIPAAKPIIKTR